MRIGDTPRTPCDYNPPRMPSSKVVFQGQTVDAETVAVTEFDEHANVYKLEDGTTLTMRTVVVQVARIDGMYDDTGNPIYNVRSQNVLAVESPENLRLTEDDTSH